MSDSFTFEAWEMMLAHKSTVNTRQDKLSLPSMISITIPKNMSIIYTSQFVSKLSPNIFTRISTFYISQTELNWETILVPSIKKICGKLIQFGISVEFLLGIFNYKIKALIEAVENIIDSLNVKMNMISLIRIFEDFVNSGIMTNFSPMKIEETHSENELAKIVDKNYSHKISEISEFKSRIESTIIHAFIWSFGVQLDSSKRQRFDKILKESQKWLKLKHFYPSNIFDSYIDWPSFTYLPIYDEPSRYLYDLSPSNYIILPSESLSKANYLFHSIFLTPLSYNHNKYLKHLQLTGPRFVGKSSIIKHFLYKNSEIYHGEYQMIITGAKKTKYMRNIFKKSHFKRSKPVILAVDDISMASSMSETLKFWIETQGTYDRDKKQFFQTENTNFISARNEEDLEKDQFTHVLYLDCPSNKIFPKILAASLHETNSSQGLLINQHSKSIISVYSSIKNTFETIEFSRILKNFQNLVYFLKKFDNLNEENIGNMLGNEIIHGFKEFKTELEPMLADIIAKKFMTSLDVKCLYIDWTHQKFDAKITDESCQSVIEDVLKMVRDSNDSSLSDVCINFSSLKLIWSILRVLNLENSHGIIQIPSGDSPYDFLKVACLLSKTKIIEPVIKQLQDLQNFKMSFEKAIQTILEFQEDVVFLIRDYHLKDDKYVSFLNYYLISRDQTVFGSELNDKITRYDLEKKKNSKNKEENPLLSASDLIKSKFHLIIISDRQDFKSKYPKLSEMCEIIKADINHTTIRNLSQEYENVISEVIQLLSYNFTILNQIKTLESHHINKKYISLYICPKRRLIFNEIFSEVHLHLQNVLENLKENYSQNLENYKENSILVQKYKNKCRMIDTINRCIISECLMLAINAVYLGFLNTSQRSEIRIQLTNLFESKGLFTDPT